MEIYNFSDFDFLGNSETDPPPLLSQNPSCNNNIFTNFSQPSNPNNSLIITTSNTSTQPIIPIQQPQSQPQSSSRVKTKFTKLEDEIIIRFVREKGAHSWNRIIPLLPGRTPRLVRERWVNYLSPDVNLSPFTKEEDQLLMDLVKSHGKHWKYISQSFNKRTDIALKNRYMLLQRRERSNLLKQQKTEQRLPSPQPQLAQSNISYSNQISLPQSSFSTTKTSLFYNPPPCLQSDSNESCLDLSSDTESFPTLDDAVAYCSEWEFGSYQCDDLPLMCDFQF